MEASGQSTEQEATKATRRCGHAWSWDAPPATARLWKITFVSSARPEDRSSPYSMGILKTSSSKMNSLRLEGQTVYVALNLADSAQQTDFRIDEGFSHLTDVLTGESFSGDGWLSLPIAACSARILVLHNGSFSGLTTEQAAVPCSNEPKKPLQPDIPVVTPGRYRHYKGKEYEVLGIAQHSETKEKMVVYKALYEGGGLWVRPYDLFTQTVEHNGHTMARFTKIME